MRVRQGHSLGTVLALGPAAQKHQNRHVPAAPVVGMAPGRHYGKAVLVEGLTGRVATFVTALAPALFTTT